MMSLGGKARAFGQKLVGARADVDLALQIVGLALLVERHHDDRRAVSPDQLCLAQEIPLRRSSG